MLKIFQPHAEETYRLHDLWMFTKREYMYSCSHNLKTEMVSILGGRCPTGMFDLTRGLYWGIYILAHGPGSTDQGAAGPFRTTGGKYSPVCLEQA